MDTHIDRGTGTIRVFEGCSIEPALTRSVFLTTPVGRSALAHKPMGASVRYDLFTGFPSSKQSWVTVRFESDRLGDVEIMLACEGDAASWSDWSIDTERRRKALHDEFLRTDLGDPIQTREDERDPPWEGYQAMRYKFAWGTVESLYIAQSANSAVLVTYAKSPHPPPGLGRLLRAWRPRVPWPVRKGTATMGIALGGRTLPDWDFEPPFGYRWLFERGLIAMDGGDSRLEPWYYADSDEAMDLMQVVPNGPYVGHGRLIIFGVRNDCDDRAVFEVIDGKVARIISVNVGAPEGYQLNRSFATIWEWLMKEVIRDVAIWLGGDVD
ncbi:MAG TPA: hypothetical protein VGM37_13040 [Armatimonadota bacterium]